MKYFVSELLLGPIPRVPGKLKLPKDLRSSIHKSLDSLLIDAFVWTWRKPKELKEVRFSFSNPEEGCRTYKEKAGEQG